MRVKGCTAQDSYLYELGDKSELMLATALAYKDTGYCASTVTSSYEKSLAVRGRSPSSATVIFGPPSRELSGPKQSIMDSNRDMYMPPKK